MTGSDLLLSAISQSVKEIVEAETHLEIGVDARWVHAARVSVRRLRSDLRMFSPFLGSAWITSVREDLRRYGELLGQVRDFDVIISRLGGYAAKLPDCDRFDFEGIMAGIVALRKIEQERLRHALQEPRYRALRCWMLDALQGRKLVETDQIPERIREVVMQQTWRKLKKAVHRLKANPSDEELHHLRIRAKRCRYAAEAVALVSHGHASCFIERIGELQNILGAFHDCIITASYLRHSARTNNFIVGELAGMNAIEQTSLRDEWRNAWHRVSRKRLRFWTS